MLHNTLQFLLLINAFIAKQIDANRSKETKCKIDQDFQIKLLNQNKNDGRKKNPHLLIIINELTKLLLYFNCFNET